MISLYQETRAALRESGFRPRKKLGQHFLIHERVIQAIVRLADLGPEDNIVEIGPGLGFLTRRLLETAGGVWAIELDAVLAERLRRGPIGSHPRLHLLQGDFLKLDLNSFLPTSRVKLVANLPYSVSTPILFRLFEMRNRFSLLVLMVQREVAGRMGASPGTKSYGSLSVWCQVHGEIMSKVEVSPEAFFPRPKVRSTALKIQLYPDPLLPAADLSLLRGLVRAAFGQRRKTLANALAGLLGERRGEIGELLRRAGVDPRRRGETLSIEEFKRLTGALRDFMGSER